MNELGQGMAIQISLFNIGIIWVYLWWTTYRTATPSVNHMCYRVYIGLFRCTLARSAAAFPLRYT